MRFLLIQNALNHLSKLHRRKKVLLQIGIDTFLIALSFFVSMSLHFENFSFLQKFENWIIMLLSISITLISLKSLGFYSVLVRYISGKLLFSVGKAALIGASVFYISCFVLSFEITLIIPVAFANFIFLFVGGLRFVARELFTKNLQSQKQRIIIYGAGEAGRQLLKSLLYEQNYLPIAFIDDDEKLKELTIGGLLVYGPNQLPTLAKNANVETVLLAIPSLGYATRKKIVTKLERQGLKIKTVPGISDIISGRAGVSELQNIPAEDLLGREPVSPNNSLLSKNIIGQVVLVTGAGGSIGSELSRQILQQSPATLILYEISEIALYKIEVELTETINFSKSNTKIIPILGSIRDKTRIEATIKSFKVQTVYHAAAYKHVPLVEENIIEGIFNNVFGTLTLATASKELGVKNFILISTDKAVRPTNIMGATKRIAELVCQALDQEKSNTIFSMVRFGNVLGSSGSVIPRFQSQIENGGPVTVTHKEMTRYFMTIPEAAELVIQAGAMGTGGTVFVLDMGEPVKILDLAVQLVKLYGLRPYMLENQTKSSKVNGDIAISVIGNRKGEKLFEELLISNNPKKTNHSRIMKASELSVDSSELKIILDKLNIACQDFDIPKILKILQELPIQYTPSNRTTSDIIWNSQDSDNNI